MLTTPGGTISPFLPLKASFLPPLPLHPFLTSTVSYRSFRRVDLLQVIFLRHDLALGAFGARGRPAFLRGVFILVATSSFVAVFFFFLVIFLARGGGWVFASGGFFRVFVVAYFFRGGGLGFALLRRGRGGCCLLVVGTAFCFVLDRRQVGE